MRKILLYCLLSAAAHLAASDSDIDTSFGIFSTGHNVISINRGGDNADYVAEVLTAADGSLYLVGSANDTLTDFRIALVRLLPNGQIDTNFGNGGKFLAPTGTNNTLASAAAFDADGNILVAGTRRISADNSDFTVCKFIGAGVTQFSSTNTPCITVAFDLGGTLQDVARDMLVLSDGRIVLVGSAHSAAGDEAAVAVINADGTPDTGFGPGGKRHWLTAGRASELLYGAAYQTGGILIAVGEGVTTPASDHGALVAKVSLADGTLYYSDLDFLKTASGPAYYRDVSIRPNNPPVAVGSVSSGGKMRGVLARLTSGGEYDATFDNNNGYATLNAGDAVELTKVIEQSDGKFLVAGTLTETGGGASSLIVGRYNAGGSLDVSAFNLLQGWREIDFALPGSYGGGAKLTLQAGRPGVAGSADVAAGGTDYDFGVARLQNALIWFASFGVSQAAP